jgi:hypothetical protein
MILYMYLTLWLTIASASLFLIFFVVYNKNIIKWIIRPNLISRSLFSLITLINSATYLSFTSDILKSALLLTDCFTCLVITCLILFRKYYSKPNTFEWLIIIFSLLSLLCRYLFHSAIYANLLLQPSYILAFLPTYRNARKNPQDENALVWFMRALSFVLNIMVISILWQGVWVDLANPVIALIMHTGLWVLALRKVDQTDNKYTISNQQ